MDTALTEDQRTELATTAKKVVAHGKGVLAADEINATMEKRFSAIDVANTAKNRRIYRNMLFTAKEEFGLNEYISGIIVNEETFHQQDQDGKKMVDVIRDRGILVGIKLDKGVVPLPGTSGEMTAQGLDGLDARCSEYKKLGASFAKWRCVLKVSQGEDQPSHTAMQENANVLARYASVCQQNGLVPIVEPEVLRDGDHGLNTAQKVTEQVLSYTYKALMDHHVFLEGSLLKPNMVTAGQSCAKKYTPQEIAKATVTALQRTVPSAMPGIVFLSGGQSEQDSTDNLNAMNRMDTIKPWRLSFSFARALQASVLKTWKGKPEYCRAAQVELLKRAHANGMATQGKYDGGSVTFACEETLFTENYTY